MNDSSTDKLITPSVILAVHTGVLNAAPVREWKQKNRREGMSKNTQRAYDTAREQFLQFCTDAGVSPDDVVGYPEAEQRDRLQFLLCAFAEHLYQRGLKYTTINTRTFAVISELQAEGFPLHNLPDVAAKMKAVQRRIAEELSGGTYTRKKKQAAPITNQVLLAMLDTLDLELQRAERSNDKRLPVIRIQHLRNRAILLIGRSAAFRRSEMAKLNIEDIEDTGTYLVMELHGTKTSAGKTDRAVIGAGARARTCPVTAYRDWIQAAGITTGPVFRAINKGGAVQQQSLTDAAIRLIVCTIAKAAGLDTDRITAHSLRAGFATEANRKNLSLLDIMTIGRWARPETVKEYIREEESTAVTAVAKMGL